MALMPLARHHDNGRTGATAYRRARRLLAVWLDLDIGCPGIASEGLYGLAYIHHVLGAGVILRDDDAVRQLARHAAHALATFDALVSR